MKFGFLHRLMAEQGVPTPVPAPAVSPAPAATTSSSIAQIPWPIGASMGPQEEYRSRNRKKKSRRRVNEAVYDDGDTGTDPKIGAALPRFKNTTDYVAQLLNAFSENVSPYMRAFGLDVSNDKKGIVVNAPTGRDYRIDDHNGWLIAAPDHDKIEFVDGKPFTRMMPFLAWELPKDISQVLTFEETLWKSVFEFSNWVLRIESMLEFPAFVDTSVDKPLSPKELKELAAVFNPILDPKTYDGAFNNMEAYREKYGDPNIDISGLPLQPSKLPSLSFLFSPSEIEDKKSWWTSTISEAREWLRPLADQDNKPDRQFLPVEYEWPEQARKIAECKWRGKKGEILNPSYVHWGESIRFECSNNIVNTLQVLVPNRWGEMMWTCVYAFPLIPVGSFDEFLGEFRSFLKNYKPPTTFEETQAQLDWPEMLMRTWNGIVREWYFSGGLAYYRDGEWGMFFYANSQGTGIPWASQGFTAGTHYAWKLQPDGTIHFFANQMQRNNQTIVAASGQPDIQFDFYPSVGADSISETIIRYTYSS